jgi:hypothetical protein
VKDGVNEFIFDLIRGHFATPYLSSIRYNVLLLMPRSEAVRRLFPPHARSTAMVWRLIK